MSDQAERFRQKVRDRNLGNVQVQTYPSSPGDAQRARVLSKLELHRQAQAEAPAPVEPEPAKVEAPAPKVEPKADDKRK